MSAIIIHAVNNAVSMFFENNIFLLIGQSENTVFFLFMMTSLFLIALLICFGCAEKIFYKKGLAGDPVEFLKERRFKKDKTGGIGQALLSPSFILCAVIFAANVIQKIVRS